MDFAWISRSGGRIGKERTEDLCSAVSLWDANGTSEYATRMCKGGLSGLLPDSSSELGAGVLVSASCPLIAPSWVTVSL